MNEELKQIMKFLVPQYKFLALLMFSKKNAELHSLKLRIKNGLNSNSVIAFDEKNKYLDIDIKSLEKEKGKSWVSALKKQLKVIEETIKV